MTSAPSLPVRPVTGALPRLTLRQLLGDRERLPDRLAAMVAGSQDLVPLRAGPLRVVVVTDPHLARALLTAPTGVRKGRGIDALRNLLHDGLLTSEGELHRRQRRLIQPAFTPARLAGYAVDAVACARALADRWDAGDRLDLAEEMSALTLEIVGRTLFGAEVRDERAEVAAAMDEVLADFPVLMRPGGLMLLRLPTPLRSRMRRATAQLDAVVARLVARRRAEGGGDDVLSMLLAARDEETGDPMSDALIRDEALTLLLAGHETTAVALSWTWWHLAREPRARALLATEVSSPLARTAVEAGAWDRLPVSRAVIAESMRLNPPAYVVGRRVTHDQSLVGHGVRAGSLCLVPTYGLHRDPRSWSEADQFRPQRWLDATGRFDEAAPDQPRGAYLPFGAGARICIGAQFAWMEATLVLASLAARFRPEIEAGYHPGYAPAVTLRLRHGLPVTLARA